MIKTISKPLQRVLIADDHELVRRGMKSLLEFGNNIEVSEASNGREAVQKTREWKPDLVILDISMPLIDGFTAAREIREFAPRIPILIVSLSRTEAFVDVARKIGINGYLIKSESSANLLEAVSLALRNLSEVSTLFP